MLYENKEVASDVSEFLTRQDGVKRTLVGRRDGNWEVHKVPSPVAKKPAKRGKKGYIIKLRKKKPV